MSSGDIVRIGGDNIVSADGTKYKPIIQSMISDKPTKQLSTNSSGFEVCQILSDSTHVFVRSANNQNQARIQKISITSGGLVATTSILSNSPLYQMGMAMDDNYIYTPVGSSINVYSKSNLSFVKSIVNNFNAITLMVHNGRLFVLGEWSQYFHFRVYDTETNQQLHTTSLTSHGSYIQLVGTLVYVSEGTNSFRRFGVSTYVESTKLTLAHSNIVIDSSNMYVVNVASDIITKHSLGSSTALNRLVLPGQPSTVGVAHNSNFLFVSTGRLVYQVRKSDLSIVGCSLDSDTPLPGVYTAVGCQDDVVYVGGTFSSGLVLAYGMQNKLVGYQKEGLI